MKQQHSLTLWNIWSHASRPPWGYVKRQNDWVAGPVTLHSRYETDTREWKTQHVRICTQKYSSNAPILVVFDIARNSPGRSDSSRNRYWAWRTSCSFLFVVLSANTEIERDGAHLAQVYYAGNPTWRTAIHYKWQRMRTQTSGSYSQYYLLYTCLSTPTRTAGTCLQR